MGSLVFWSAGLARILAGAVLAAGILAACSALLRLFTTGFAGAGPLAVLAVMAGLTVWACARMSRPIEDALRRMDGWL